MPGGCVEAVVSELHDAWRLHEAVVSVSPDAWRLMEAVVSEVPDAWRLHGGRRVRST